MRAHKTKPAVIIKRYGIYLFLAWTVIVALFLGLTLYLHHLHTIEAASIEARTHYDLNRFYRNVISDLGGLYVTVDKIEPNPYLYVPEKFITTDNGKTLTLVNPAYLTRLVFDAVRAGSPFPVVNKITSLKVLNPINEPDAWERAVLLSFERGNKEAREITSINGEKYLRLMRPFMTEKSCLKCHAHQGYKVGDVRGGISIAVPLRPYEVNEGRSVLFISIFHVILWAIVSVSLFFFTRLTMRNAEAYGEMEALSLHDPLTGLANRRMMEMGLEDSFNLAKRYSNPLTLMMADLDHFKEFNDSHGHRAGDDILVRVAEIIKREIRKTDLAVRYGGEEFLVLFKQTGAAEAASVAERVRKAVEETGGVTISIGLACLTEESKKYDDLINGADRALYEAKRKGRNRIEMA